MATSSLPVPTLQPLPDEKNPIQIVADEGSSCCGGGCCGSN
ncbi:hypothetical protein AB3M83_07005 [Microbacterium sp. 179-B 1A2 NHS]